MYQLNVRFENTAFVVIASINGNIDSISSFLRIIDN